MVYEHINQIFKDGKRLVDDFTDADLSHLDLSDIPIDMWKDATFKNTNFSGTNIKFNPKNLKTLQMFDFFTDDRPEFMYQNMQGCNFENCDLSYLGDTDLYNVIISNCNFSNTGLNIDFSREDIFNEGIYQYASEALYNGSLLSGVILPKTYSQKNYEYWDSIKLDIEFIKKNSDVKISSGKLLQAMKKDLKDVESKVFSMKDYEKKVSEMRDLLIYDKQGTLERFYLNMKPCFQDYRDEILFFRGVITFTSFDELDLSYLSPKLLLQFIFENCDIKLLKLPVGFKELSKQWENEKEKSYFISKKTC